MECGRDAGVAHMCNSATDVRTSQHTAWELVAAVGRTMAPKMCTSESLEPVNVTLHGKEELSLQWNKVTD